MKNKLADLNNHLFEQLERLNDEELTGEKLTIEINRSKAMSQIAQNIIGNAKIVLDAAIAVKEWGLTSGLPLIGTTEGENNGASGK